MKVKLIRSLKKHRSWHEKIIHTMKFSPIQERVNSNENIYDKRNIQEIKKLSIHKCEIICNNNKLYNL